MIKAILFDASETLIHLPLGVAHHYQLVAARHGLALDEAVVSQAFRAIWRAKPQRPIIEGSRPEDDRGWWRDLVLELLRHCAVEPSAEKLDLFFDELYCHFALPGVWELYPDVLPVFAILRHDYILGVVSNFDRRLHAIFCNLKIDGYFDAVILSSETGADKPHPEIFHHALDRLGVAPAEALHVGDDPVRDWQGAAGAGLRCFHLDRPRNSLRDLPAVLNNLETAATSCS